MLPSVTKITDYSETTVGNLYHKIFQVLVRAISIGKWLEKKTIARKVEIHIRLTTHKIAFEMSPKLSINDCYYRRVCASFYRD